MVTQWEFGNFFVSFRIFKMVVNSDENFSVMFKKTFQDTYSSQYMYLQGKTENQLEMKSFITN